MKGQDTRSPEFRRWEAVLDAYSKEYEGYLNSPENRKWERWEMVVRCFAFVGAVFSVLLVLAVFSLPALAQTTMVAPYEGRGYAGPIGSDLGGDPLVVSTVFQGRDFSGELVEAVVPVEIDPINLDPAFNFATFNANIVDTTYLRGVFANAGVTDIDGDGVFSQVGEVAGLPSTWGNYKCRLQPGAVLLGSYANPIDCLHDGFGTLDSYGGYDLEVSYRDANLTLDGSGFDATDCAVVVSLSVPDGVFTPSSKTSVEWSGLFDAGVTVVTAADCGSPSGSITYESYDAAPLISLVPENARHAYLGDVLAAVAYNEEVVPQEWIDTAAALTAQLEDEEGECFEQADCIYPGAYNQAPLYWREGYSFVPGGALNTGGGSGRSGGAGEGFACDEDSTELACLDATTDLPEMPTEAELEGFVVDPFEGELFEDYLDEAAFEGYGETRECPEPFEIERGGIFGTGVIEMPVEPLCEVMETYINPFLMLLAWFAAGIILFRS